MLQQSRCNKKKSIVALTQTTIVTTLALKLSQGSITLLTFEHFSALEYGRARSVFSRDAGEVVAVYHVNTQYRIESPPAGIIISNTHQALNVYLVEQYPIKTRLIHSAAICRLRHAHMRDNTGLSHFSDCK